LVLIGSALVLSAARESLVFGQHRLPWPSQKDLRRQLDKAAADYFIQWRRPSHSANVANVWPNALWQVKAGNSVWFSALVGPLVLGPFSAEPLAFSWAILSHSALCQCLVGIPLMSFIN